MNVMRSELTLALLMLATGTGLLLSGCTVEANKEEGFYSCVDGGGCPPGTSCRPDGRCRVGAALVGEPCDEDDPGGPYCVQGLTCLQGNADAMALDENHFCGRLCPNGHEDCVDDETCLGGECIPYCSPSNRCADGAGDCRFPFLPMVDPDDLEAPICSNLDEMGLEGLRSCESDNDCMPPGFCLRSNDGGSICSLRCVTNSNCAMGGECIDVQAGHGQCFVPCTQEGVCGDTFTCEGTGIMGMDRTVCMPTEWADEIDNMSFQLMMAPPS